MAGGPSKAIGFVRYLSLSVTQLSYALACKQAYGRHMLECQPLAGTGSLGAPKRTFGPNFKIYDGQTHTHTLRLLYLLACKPAYGQHMLGSHKGPLGLSSEFCDRQTHITRSIIYRYIIDGVCVCLSVTDFPVRREGPLWGWHPSMCWP